MLIMLWPADISFYFAFVSLFFHREGPSNNGQSPSIIPLVLYEAFAQAPTGPGREHQPSDQRRRRLHHRNRPDPREPCNTPSPSPIPAPFNPPRRLPNLSPTHHDQRRVSLHHAQYFHTDWLRWQWTVSVGDVTPRGKPSPLRRGA